MERTVLDACAMSQHWIANAIWRDRAGTTEDDRWGVDVGYDGRLVKVRVKGAVDRTWEVERLKVMHLGMSDYRVEV